jgi:hypothetical protein
MLDEAEMEIRNWQLREPETEDPLGARPSKIPRDRVKSQELSETETVCCFFFFLLLPDGRPAGGAVGADPRVGCLTGV